MAVQKGGHLAEHWAGSMAAPTVAPMAVWRADSWAAWKAALSAEHLAAQRVAKRAE